MLDRRARGARIETMARDYLLRHGLREIAANTNYRFGELDLIMLDQDKLHQGRPDGGRRDGACIVFIEVRYRNSRRFGGGAASVDAGKRRKLVQAAGAFLAAHHQYTKSPCRFDVIEAAGDVDAPTFSWLRDAFRADDQ